MARYLNPNFDGATEWPLFNTNEDRIGINATAQLLQGDSMQIAARVVGITQLEFWLSQDHLLRNDATFGILSM